MNEKLMLKQNLQSLLDFDKATRFVGCLASDGTILSSVLRPELVPLLDTAESKKSFMHTILRASSFKAFDSKLGRTVWDITLRTKMKWLNAYLDNGNVIVMSTEANSSHDKIMQRILEIFGNRII